MLLFFKYYFRYLVKNKTVSLVNLSGLTIALVSSIVIFTYSTFEYSYDNFNKNYDNIYRLHIQIKQNGSQDYSSFTVNPPTGPTLRRTFPEIKEFARIAPFNEVVFSYNNNSYEQAKTYFADSSFFKIFSYNFLKGDPKNVLQVPNTAVITKSIAEKYFGNENPIGKLIKHKQDVSYQVVGVIDDVPENSHFQFDILLSYNSPENWLHQYCDNRWDRFWIYTYLLVEKGVDVAKLEKKINNLLNTYKTNDNTKDVWIHSLQPMKEMHLNSADDRIGVTSNGDMIRIIFMVAILILIIAYINQTNISVAQTLERLKVVAISRVVGNKPLSIVLQFVFESALTTAICFILAINICAVFSPIFSTLLGFKFSLNIMPLSTWFAYFFGLIIVATIAGVYPAFVVLSHNTNECLKSKAKHAGISILFRKGLIVLQYSIACSLIIGALVIYLQKEYMLNKDLGIEINNTIVIKGNSLNYPDSVINSRIELFKNQLKNYPQITGVTCSNALPGNNNYRDGTVSDIQQIRDMVMHIIYQVDYDFISTYRIKLIVGRDFSKDYPSDVTSSAIINEKALKTLGFKLPEEALGHIITRDWDKKKTKIIGVVKDFHVSSLTTEIMPMVLHLSPQEKRFYSVKISCADFPGTIKLLKREWESVFPGELLTYFIFEDNYKNLYQKEQKYGLILSIFSVLAIILSCFGLFGLSFYTIVQRTKEIGIRKINGASIALIIKILLADFTKLVIIAFVIACPVAYYLTNKWIEGFAYRIPLSCWIFFIAGLLSLLIALITVTWQAWRAASRNPVEALRYE